MSDLQRGVVEARNMLSPNLENSLFLMIPPARSSLSIVTLNGYIFSKWRFRGAEILVALMLFSSFIPWEAILLPLVRFLQWTDLFGTFPGLVLTYVVCGVSVTTFNLRNFNINIPGSVVEVAAVDCEGDIEIYWRVILPLSLSAFAVASVTKFTNIWNDFLFGITMVPNPQPQPVNVALNKHSGSFSVDWNVVMAGALVAVLPTPHVYIGRGTLFVRGLISGAMKA